MARRVRDLLEQRATEAFVGRAGELAALLRTLDPDAPPVVYIHGIGGIGKSNLLEAFAAQARSRGAAVVPLDCRTIEPTERGFLHELGVAIGGEAATVDEAAERLGQFDQRLVLTLDTYELFRLMDTWLRQVFIPALPDTVRVILASREPPVWAWLASPGWQGLFRTLPLGPLRDADALELLAHSNIGEDDARRINRVASGHPLALKLAAAAVTEWPESDQTRGSVAIQRLIEQLTQLYLADVRDPLTRQALDAASVVRRTTVSLLHAMLSTAAPQDAFERIQALPFVETAGDGLRVHDVVQQGIAAALRATHPSAYQEYRRAAWCQLRAEVRVASTPDLWRYTADLLYLVENPVVREAFFPSGAHLYVVEPARPEDAASIHAIAVRHEGPHGGRLLGVWWERAPQSFSVVRNRDGTVAGFYCMLDSAMLPPELIQDDPVVREWRNHLRNAPIPKNQRVLFLRRWLSAEHGEMPSPVQAACWLDIKRSYMEMRPHLRRVYLTVSDLPTYAPVAMKLCFQPLADAQVKLHGVVYHTAMLDFGPSSVDGWLAGLVAAELGVEEDDILDIEAHELVVDDQRIGLTPLEFAVMLYLYQREGGAVTRTSLLEDVWGYDYEGDSNVVDVVIRSLRKKLGERASLIETVRGVGYRLRRP